jgi:hypothetical protein
MDRMNAQRTVRIYRLGEEPRDDLSDSTTAEERLEILRVLSERVWTLSGKPFPSYARSEIPVRIVRAR